MPSDSGEIRYDRDDMPEDARQIAHLLDTYGRASFSYAAFGTLHRMWAIDSTALLLAVNSPRESGEYEPPVQRPLWIGEFGMPAGIADPREGCSHTLWLREGHDNKHTATWLGRGGYHTPEYVASKFLDGNLVDGYGLAMLMALIEQGRESGLVIKDVRELADKWSQRVEELLGGVRALEPPQFLAGEPA